MDRRVKSWDNRQPDSQSLFGQAEAGRIRGGGHLEAARDN